MIHEIFPKKFHVEYENITPVPGDTVLLFDGENVCCRVGDGETAFPVLDDFPNAGDISSIFLFSIDDERFFMPDMRMMKRMLPPEGFTWQEHTIFRTTGPQHLAFAAVTAHQLYLWYNGTQFCGCCGAETRHSERERACVCTECGCVYYPKISPVVIVAVKHGENLLVTRYKDRPYRRYALVAGFSEIGESLEDTVRREVMEETGVCVKNIRYYKSQPWGFTSTLLSGFYCELDGDPAIHIDENELSEALWLERSQIPPPDNSVALTAEMMEVFRTGGEK